MNGKIYDLYLDLHGRYGNAIEYWPQWCAKRKSEKTRELIALGAILTQRTSWNNAHLALENLNKSDLLSVAKIVALDDLNQLAELIKPSGFYQTKPKRLWSFSSFIVNEYGSMKSFRNEKLNVAREKLLGVYGIGPETADTVLLYALDKPSFVIDEYTKRFVEKEELARKFEYDYLKKVFEGNLPKDVEIFQNYHALIIRDQVGMPGSVMKMV